MEFELIMTCGQNQLYCASGFIAAGLVILIIGIKLYRKCISCRYWPMTDGKILSNRDFPDIDDPAHARGIKPEQTRYSYNVDGVEYCSSCLELGTFFPSRCDLVEKAIKYRHGMRVAVQYNPAKYTESVLENQEMTRPLFMILASIICLLLGSVLLINFLLVNYSRFSAN